MDRKIGPGARAIRRGARVGSFLCLALSAAGGVPAQSAESPEAGGAATAREMANEVNDPTAPITLIQLRDVIAPSVPGFDGAANVFELEPILPILPSRRIKLTQLIKVTFPVLVTTPNPGRETGLGDLEVFDLFTVKASWGRWGFGPALVFPTATSPSMGQGKWQAGPAAAFIYTGTKHLQVGAVLQNPISCAGDSDQASVNQLEVTPTLTYNFEHGWFAGSSDFNWTFNWEDGGAATIPVGVQAGKVVQLGKRPVSLSLEVGYTVVRPSDTSTPKWVIGIEITPILGVPKRRS
jgi:hypothetical protein